MLPKSDDFILRYLQISFKNNWRRRHMALNFQFAHDTMTPADGGAPGDDSEARKRTWRARLFECGKSLKMSCVVWWCFPCTVAQVFQRTGAGGCRWVGITLSLLTTVSLFTFMASIFVFASWPSSGVLAIYSGVAIVGVAVLALVAVFVISGVILCVSRQRVRRKLQFTSNDCNDCLASFLCGPCVACQIFVETGLATSFEASDIHPYRGITDVTGDGRAWRV